MKIHFKKAKLLKVIQSTLNKKLHQAFIKIMLAQSQLGETEGKIRHYDIECEASEMIFDILSLKITTTFCQSFGKLKNLTYWPKKKKIATGNYCQGSNRFSRLNRKISLFQSQLRLNFKGDANLRKINTPKILSPKGKQQSEKEQRPTKTASRSYLKKENQKEEKKMLKKRKRELILWKLNEIDTSIQSLVILDSQNKTPYFESNEELLKNAEIKRKQETIKSFENLKKKKMISVFE